VRHNLVGRIVDAYTKYDSEKLADRYERDSRRENASENRGRTE